MQINWKIAAPIAVVVIALVAALTGMSGRKEPADMAVGSPDIVLMPTASPEAPAAESAPPVSGNVDDLALSLFGEADQDLAFSAESDEDMALVTSDSASINGYATAYDETTF
jgi:hypothetical protein